MPRTESAQRVSGTARAERGMLPPCPVTGEQIAFSIKALTNDGPVYFSSEEARDTFNAAPEKYARQTAAQREALKKLPRVQVTCPVTGNPIDGKTQIFTDGKVVDFCCTNCVSKFDSAELTERERRAYDAKLEASYTYQTRCPLSGDPIDPTVYAEIAEDLRVYFCCAGDRDAFVKGLKRAATTSQPSLESPRPNSDASTGKKGAHTRPSGHEGHGAHP